MITQLDLDGTTQRELKQVTQVDLDGTTVRNLKEVWQNDSTGAPKLIFSALSVSISPGYLSASTNRRTTGPITVGSAGVVIVGGTAPFTYAWHPDSGFSATPAASPSVTVVSPPVAGGESVDGSLYVTVTDASGAVATSDTISLFASNYGI